MKKFLYLSIAAGLFTLPTACAKTPSDTVPPPAVVTETGAAAPDTQQPQAGIPKTDNPQTDTAETETARPESELQKNDTVTYSYEDVYLSLTLPDGWDYQIKTKEEMEQEDSFLLCAINFWPSDFPDAVFSLGYQAQKPGICGTGVTIEPFSLPNGLTGYRYTESIEDILWLTVSFDTNEEKAEPDLSGTYLIQATPGLSAWEQISPEFEQIFNSVQVGAAFSAP